MFYCYWVILERFDDIKIVELEINWLINGMEWREIVDFISQLRKIERNLIFEDF